MSRTISRFREATRAAGRGVVLAAAGLGGSGALFVATVLSAAFLLLGVGFLTTPYVLEQVRRHANRRRALAARWSDVRIPVPYRPLPKNPRTGFTGRVELTLLMLKDPATRRDVQWLFTDMTAGFTLAVLPAVLMVWWVEGAVLAAGLWRVFRDHPYWYGFVPVDSQVTAIAALVLGVAVFHLGLWAGGPLLRLNFRLARAVLSPTPADLARRIDRLTETRHEAVDSAASEIRRIERDLHDGAQARLVAVGMSLGTIEALIEKNPEQAKRMLAAARASSAEALTELRDLVRGIHPPVLAERGLGDAVRALALRLPLESEVTVDLPGRPDAPVESAAYFAVSEALTNAAKHADADRVWIDVHHTDGMLRVSVTDNGRGGAAIGGGAEGRAGTGGGSGLSGIERRLGTFDGVLAVSSPVGGPTLVTLEIPCALS
ncbi:histidine kinase [Streptomyces sp. NPDC002308]